MASSSVQCWSEALIGIILTFEIISWGNGSWSRYTNQQLYRRWTRQWTQLDGAPLTVVVDWDFANRNCVVLLIKRMSERLLFRFSGIDSNFETSRRRRKIAFIPRVTFQLIAITCTWAASFWQLNKSLSQWARQLDMVPQEFLAQPAARRKKL